MPPEPQRRGTIVLAPLVLAVLVGGIAYLTCGPGDTAEPPKRGAARGDAGVVLEDQQPPTATERKITRIELVLDEVDLSLHAVRISWPGDKPWRWEWPGWLTKPQLASALGELVKVADSTPELPAVDSAARSYARRIAADADTLEADVAAWNVVESDPAHPTSKPTFGDLVELFERIGSTSHALRAAIAAVPRTTEAARGSPLALHRTCSDAAGTIAYLPGSVRPAEATGPSVFGHGPSHDEIAAKARACMRVAIDYLERPVYDEYVAGLALSIGQALLRELERDARGKGSYVSSTTNVAQPASYLARKLRSL